MPRNVRSEQVAQLIGRARRVLTGGVRRHLALHGQSLLDWQVVNALVRGGALSQIALAEFTGHHPAGLSRLLTSLQGAGLVTRKTDARDRRRVVVAVTPLGMRWHTRWKPEVEASISNEMSRLSRVELRKLQVLLTKLVGAQLAVTAMPMAKRRA